MCETDESCVRACLNGHPEVYRKLVQRHEAPLLRYLRGEMGGEEAAMEASQEAFVRAYFALRKLRKPGSFFSWLLGIAARVAKEAKRGERRSTSLDSLGMEPAEGDGRRVRLDVPVGQAVGELPDVYRQVIALRFYAGLSCGEISQHLGVPIGTVTKRLSRAYALLRTSLREEEMPEDVEARS